MKMILIGAGGHARSCISCLEYNGIEILGLLDCAEMVGKSISGYSVLGTDENIMDYIPTVDGFLISVGQIEQSNIRSKIYLKVISAGGKMPVIITSDAFVDRNVLIGNGSMVMHRAFINSGVQIGVNAIINSCALIEHDVFIGDHVHISTSAVINGGCCIGNGSFIGSGAILRNNISIGSNVIIGAGTIVVKDLIEPGTYAGNPARRIR